MNEADMHGTLEAAKNEGLQEGRKKEKLEIARAMLKANLSVNQISKLTGLSGEEIESLQS